MRVLLALADTEGIDAELAWLKRFKAALADPVDVILLHVVPISAEGIAGVMHEYAEQDLAAIRARLCGALGDEQAELRVRAGSPGSVICEEARDVDLVVVRPGGRGQLGELLLGSTSAYVTHHAPCNVLVLRKLGG